MPQPIKCSCGFGCRTAPRRGLEPAIAAAARSFEAVVGRAQAGFCCPLCLRQLAVGCATRAHYPAKKVDGKRWTLLCKACNSFLGTKFEADAQRHFHAVPAEVRISSLTVGPLRAVLRVDSPVASEQSVISLDLPKGVGADVMALLTSDLLGDRKMRLTIQAANPDRVRLAVLSWAYLGAFAKYGYAFALEPALQSVRIALLTPEESDLPPTMVLWPSDAPPLGDGRPVLVVAVRETSDEIHLLGLGFHFGRAIGVLPIAADLEGRGYRGLEEINFADPTGWIVQVPPPEILIPGAADVLFATSSRLSAGLVRVVGVEPGAAQTELRDHQLTPDRPGPAPRYLKVPEEPPTEPLHQMTSAEWERTVPPDEVMARYATDLLHVAVQGRDAKELEDLSDRDMPNEINRVRSYFPLGQRPEVLRRGQLMVRSGRELAWHWATIFWPDGSTDNVGAFFTRAALIEAIDRVAARRLS